MIGMDHKVLTYNRVQSSVWRLPNYWPPTPLSTQRVCPPAIPKRGGGYTLAGRWGGGGTIFWKTPDIGLASCRIIPLRNGCSVCRIQSANGLGSVFSKLLTTQGKSDIRQLFIGKAEKIINRVHGVSLFFSGACRLRLNSAGFNEKSTKVIVVLTCRTSYHDAVLFMHYIARVRFWS